MHLHTGACVFTCGAIRIIINASEEVSLDLAYSELF
jgi:hypothetical protein